MCRKNTNIQNNDMHMGAIKEDPLHLPRFWNLINYFFFKSLIILEKRKRKRKIYSGQMT